MKKTRDMTEKTTTPSMRRRQRMVGMLGASGVGGKGDGLVG